MNEQLTRQLIHQLKILNIWITLFGSLLVAGLIVLAVLLFSLVGFIKATNSKVDSIKSQASNSVNLQKQACEGTGKFSSFLKNSTDICD